MAFGLLNLFMLFGMVAVAIPIIIHLLNRRRFDVVDWGAMRFLLMSETTRRRVFIEELVLMLLRMGLLAILVLAMCAPFASSAIFEWLGFVENRDIVLVFDGSTAMSYVDDDGKTAHQKAVEWAKQTIGKLTPGDIVAVIQAREQPITFLRPTSDVSKVREVLDKLPAPAGACDWPAAVETANGILKTGGRSRRDVVLLGAARKSGWSDDRTMERWKLLAPQLADGKTTARLWMVPFAEDRPAELPNWSLMPIRAETTGWSRNVEFRASLRIRDQDYAPPYSLRYEIDLPPGETRAKEDADRLGGDIVLPREEKLKDGRIPLTFRHTLPSPGSHLVSVIVQPDGPPEAGKERGKLRDRLIADNRRDFALSLPLLPVLIVDSLPPSTDPAQGGGFIRAAISEIQKSASQHNDHGNLMGRATIAPLQELEAALKRDVGPEPNTPPRVLVLCDVPELTPPQQEAVEAFVKKGGGLLITVGPRAKAAEYNRDLYRDGAGILPAPLEKPVGDENEPAPREGQPDRAAHPLLPSFNHAALNEFQKRGAGGIDRARFPKWWQLGRPTAGTASIVADLVAHTPKPERTPWLIEKKLGEGRVLLCSVPLENSWGTNFHTRAVQEFPLLAHNLVAYLSGPRVTDYTLAPGQPLVYPLADDERGVEAQPTVKTPLAEVVPVEIKDGTLTYRDTQLSGVYVLTTPRNRTVYFVVQPDANAADDMALWTDDDKSRLVEVLRQRGREAANPSKAAAIPLAYTTDAATILRGPDRDVWWLLIVVVTLLLCVEVWMTRRIARGR